MNDPQKWIYAAAGFNVALAGFHLCFWRIFRWQAELPRLHAVNRGAMQMMNIMLIVGFLLAAGLQLAFTQEMTTTTLGRALLGSMTVFWLVRALLQPVVFSGPPLVRWAFGFIFLLGSALHAGALWG